MEQPSLSQVYPLVTLVSGRSQSYRLNAASHSVTARRCEENFSDAKLLTRCIATILQLTTKLCDFSVSRVPATQNVFHDSMNRLKTVMSRHLVFILIELNPYSDFHPVV